MGMSILPDRLTAVRGVDINQGTERSAANAAAGDTRASTTALTRKDR